MTHLTLVVRNITRRRHRAVLTVMAVAVCLFLFTCLVTVLQAMDSVVARSRTHRRVVVHARSSVMLPMPASYKARLERIPGVEAVMSWVLCLGFGRSESLLLAVVAVEPDDYARVMYEQVPGPEELRRFKSDRTAALFSRLITEREHLAPGDRFRVKALYQPIALDLKVAGTIWKNLNPTTIFCHRSYMTELTGDHGANIYVLKVPSLDHVPSVLDAVHHEFESDAILVNAEPEHAMISSFLVNQGTVLTLVHGVGLLTLISITLVMGNTMAMTVRERTHEVGVLKALGFSMLRVLGLVLGESVILAIAGGTVGTVMAYLLLSRGFAVGYGPFSSLTVQGSTVVVGVLTSFAIGVVAGGLPAWRAARLPVVASLRRVM